MAELKTLIDLVRNADELYGDEIFLSEYIKKIKSDGTLSEIDSMALQESLRNLDRAYENFCFGITDLQSRFPM